MDVLQLSLAFWGLFAITRFVVVPRADTYAHTRSNPDGLKAAAIASFVGFLSIASLLLAISASLVSLGVMVVNRMGGATVADLQNALASVDSIAAQISSFDSGLGIAATAILIVALAWHSFRSGRVQLSREVNAKLNEELQRLDAAMSRGELEDLESTPQMAELQEVFDEIAARARAPDLDDNDREVLEEQLSSLAHRYRLLDLFRRADTTVDRDQPVQGPLNRLLLALGSQGMVRSMSGLGRLMAVIGLFLLIPSSLAMGTTAISDATETKWLELTDRIDQIELEVSQADVETAFEQLEVADTGQVVGELSAEDEAAIDEIASLFESEVVQARFLSGVRPAPLSRAVARSVSSTRARNAILEAVGTRPSAAESTTVLRAENPDAMQVRSARMTERAARADGPATSLGERYRVELREQVPHLDRSSWSNVRAKVADFTGSFQRPASARDLRAMMVSDALGHVADGVNVDGPVERLLQQGTRQVTGDVAERAYRTESRRFLVELARADNVSDALDRVGQARAPMSQASTRAVRQSASRVPAVQNVNPSSLAVKVDPAIDIRGAQRTVQNIATARYGAPGAINSGAADALLNFGDLFPGQPSEAARSPRTQTLSKMNPQLRSARATKTSYTRARSYGRIRGFSRIGGVLIGRPPETPQGGLELEDFTWQVGEKVALSLIDTTGNRRELGRFAPAVVHAALAYAADGRVTTVTMVQAEPMLELKILLHPALIDTGVGCRAIRLDQLADEATSGNQGVQASRSAASESVYFQNNLYGYAWGRRVEMLLELGFTDAYNQFDPQGMLQSRARNLTGSVDIQTAIEERLPWTDLELLTAKTAFYDPKLVNTLKRCTGRRTESEFAACLDKATISQAPTYLADEALTWLAPPPGFVEWSGVREQPYDFDPEFEFITRHRVTDPLRFMVQVAFNSPAWFAAGSQPWYAEDNSAVRDHTDMDPWEFDLVHTALMREIAVIAESDPEVRDVLDNMSEFAFLQRLFRGMIDGQLRFAQFDPERLAELASETGVSVSHERTMRWLPRPGLVEQSMLNLISTADAYTPAMEQCGALIIDAYETGVASISSEQWDSFCALPTGVAEFDTQASMLSNIRQLRDQLNIDADIAVSQSMYTAGCPTL